jgi:hypothetical protein
MYRQDAIITRAFQSHEGQEALKVLRLLFYDKSTYVRGDSYHTAYQEGLRDVVGFILDAINEGKKHNDTIQEIANS